MLKLLHVIHDLDPVKGGPSQNLLQLARGYASVGVDLEALTLDPPGAPYLARYPFLVHGFDCAGSTYGYSPAAAQWLQRNVGRFDGVVIDGMWQHLGVAARAAALQERKPYVVFPHGTLDRYFKRAHPIKHLKKQLFWWTAQYRILRDAHRVVFTTEQERELACGTFWPSRWNAEVLALGISRPAGDPAVQRGAFLAAFPAARDRRLLLFLGRIHPKKGCDLLLRAFSRVAAADPELDLVMAGPDADRERTRLDPIVAAAGLAHRVHWTGMLQDDIKWGAFRAAEAFILPSHQENFGLAVAEAIACDTPVLISNQVNIYRDLLEDGCALVEDDTEDGTLRLIERWLGLNPVEREHMVSQTRASFERRFSVTLSASAIRSLFVQPRG